MNLFHKSMNQEHKDQVLKERVQELKMEVQGLKKEIDNLRYENTYYHDRATEASTILSIYNSTNRSLAPIHNLPMTYMPTIPAFSANPSLYSVPPTNN